MLACLLVCVCVWCDCLQLLPLRRVRRSIHTRGVPVSCAANFAFPCATGRRVHCRIEGTVPSQKRYSLDISKYPKYYSLSKPFGEECVRPQSYEQTTTKKEMGQEFSTRVILCVCVPDGAV